MVGKCSGDSKCAERLCLLDVLRRPSSGFRPRFWGPSGQGVRACQAGEYTLSSAKSQKAIEMAPTSKAFCYLTHIAGKFRGGGEVVDGTFARSRCYLLTQAMAP